MSDPLGLFGEEEQHDPLGLFGEPQKPTFTEFMGNVGDAVMDIPNKLKQSYDMYKEPWDAGIETAATIGTGAVGGVVGPLMGVQARVAGKSIEEAAAIAGDQMQRMTYEPKTPMGQDWAHNVGKVVNELIPLAPLHGTIPAIKAGEAVNAFKANRMNEVPKAKGPDLAGLTKDIEATAAKSKDPLGLFDQADLFPEALAKDAEGLAEPYNAGQAGVTEPITPKRQARQMELQLDEQPVVNIDTAGVPLRPETWDHVETVKDNYLKQMDEQAEKTQWATGPEAFKGEAANSFRGGKFNQRTKNQGGAINPEVFRAGFEQVKDMAEKGYKLVASALPGNRLEIVAYSKEGDHQLSRAVFERPMDPTKNTTSKLTMVRPDMQGKGVAQDMYKFVSELGNDISPSKDRTSDGKAMWDGFVERGIAPDGFIPKAQRYGRINKQSGMIKLPFGSKQPLEQMKKVPGMAKRLKNLLPDRRTPEEFLEQEKNSPDIEQNILQRASNYFTKGSNYQVQKTNDPHIKYVTDRLREADDLAKGATQELVHEYLEKVSRNLSAKEQADGWAALQIAQKNGQPLTPELMRKFGFNEKQIEWAEAQTDVMGKMFEKMSESLREAGLEPVSPQVAYAASRASKDFRRLFYEGVDKDGNPKVVGIASGNTRKSLNKDVEALQKKFPNAKPGEERYFGGAGRDGTSEGFSQMLEFLDKNDPAMAEFIKHVNEQAQKDAFDYMNAKTHTMEKKGIWGMEGNHPLKTNLENARDGMKAQIRYAETMIKWSEFSKAINETKGIVASMIDTKPNAKKYLDMYIDNVLQRNPTTWGKDVERLGADLGKATGIGVTIPAKVASAAKQITNGLVLGWNIPFMAVNFLTPLKVMPEMAVWLKTMGANTDGALGYGYLAKAGMDILNERKGKVEPLIQGAMDFAKKRHVYASDLFETGGDIHKGTHYYFNKATQAGTAQIEHVTRKSMFLAYVRMLNDSGITVKDGLYEAAQKVTDIAMNNYSRQEAPLAYPAMGPAGKLSYNLMSFKHNELSRFSMFVREWAKDPVSAKAAAPLLTNLMGQVAFAGIKGTILYAEANELIKYISDKLGKPTSLTKVLLESKMPDSMKFGLFSNAGADMTNRFGMQVVPDNLADVAFPAGNKLLDIGKGIVDTVKDPSEYNAKKLAVTSTPSIISSNLDRAWFSPKNAKGEELAFNKDKAQATAVRNDTDKAWKAIGATGLNESKQKSLSYENTQIEKKLQEHRMKVLNKMGEAFYTDKKIPAVLVEKYLKYEGDPSTLPKEIERMAIEQKVDQPTLQLMKAAMGNTVSSAYKLQRRAASANK